MAEDSEQQTEAQEEGASEVSAAEFSEMTDEQSGPGLSLDLVLDISMPVTVELGRTSMTIRELLQMGPGSVVELDHSAGEPIDLYVRDVRFARGEVVVVQNNFGLRISEVINAKGRIQQLGQAGEEEGES
jgi:flagellar motor switch protein FliN/FliY